MKDTKWAEAVDKIGKHVVLIETPSGAGTGFLISRGDEKVGIATAFHVVSDVVKWGNPIRLYNEENKDGILLKKDKYETLSIKKYDCALIIIDRNLLSLPNDILPLMPKVELSLRVGLEIGWCGYPSIVNKTLCFFSGTVSAWLANELAYLVDGVAINGVSGSPAFIIKDTGDIEVIGLVSAYIPNRLTGETLPGVSLVRGIHPYLNLFNKLKEKKT